ncbi:MAG: Stp1/IreP family PP2C-type Ser/Thr phosphatase [Trueperaceae bacterium]
MAWAPDRDGAPSPPEAGVVTGGRVAGANGSSSAAAAAEEVADAEDVGAAGVGPGSAAATATPAEAATRVAAAAASDAGRVRVVNQDAHWAGQVGHKGYLAVVADGMGGHQTGEVASQQALDTFLATLRSLRAHPPAALARAAQAANLEVYALASERPEHQGMGTTLTALLIDDQVGLIGHVGDSRAYRLRDGELVQLTQDHSWVADRVRQGLLSSEEARRHRWRNVITNALGAGPSFRLDLGSVDVRAGDRFLLCSDGVSAMVSEGLIAQILTDHAPQEAADALIAESNDRGSPDNVTAVVVEVAAVAQRPKRYELPPASAGPTSVEVGDTMSGIREVEDTFPLRSPLRLLRRQPWYPYRGWIVGSVYLLLLFIVFSLWRG